MKRVTTAFGAGLLALGIAVSASLAGAGAAGAAPTGAPTSGKPTLTSISPTVGETAGGGTVEVHGTNFFGTDVQTTVNFGAAGAGTEVDVVSPTEIKVVAPAYATTGPQSVQVTVAGASSADNGTSPVVTNGTYTYATPAITVKATNLSLIKGTALSISGTGWNYGDLVAVSICNADGELPDPTTQFKAGDPLSACDPLTGPNFPTVTTKGAFTAHLTVNPGLQGAAPTTDQDLSGCPQDASQATVGVACIVGAADHTTGASADEPIYFAAPALTATDIYQGEAGANQPESAEYTVTLNENGTHQESGDPPVADANGIPNNGGFATDGVICNPEVTSECVPLFSSPGVPEGCQASSNGSSTWSGETACTAGAAVGEPIELFVYHYTAPISEPTDTSPITVTTPVVPGVTEPFNCNESGCSVSANAGAAGAGITDPGGFSIALSYPNTLTGTGPGGEDIPADFTALPLTPGTYSFEALGESSGVTAKGSIALLPGPSS